MNMPLERDLDRHRGAPDPDNVCPGAVIGLNVARDDAAGPSSAIDGLRQGREQPDKVDQEGQW